jgi:protein subunit release factor B
MFARPKDVHMTFVRSSGAGGQNVNKVATCVVLKHLPSGIVVRCDKHRTQAGNRLEAWRILEGKLQAIEAKRIALIKAQKSKVRRQQQYRSKAEQEKLLRAKKLLAAKKQLRKKADY